MSTISASTTTTTAYKVAADTTGTLVLQTGATPTTAVTIDGSQNVGVGVTPSAWASANKVLSVGAYASLISNSSNGNYQLVNNLYNNGSANIYVNTNYATLYQSYQGQHQWYNAPSGTAGATATLTQAMTLDASGNLLVGTTSGVASGGFNIQPNGFGTGQSVLDIGHINGTPSAVSFQRYIYNNNVIGSITQSGTTAVLYNVTSDQRLKENIDDAPEFGSVIDSLQVRSFDWKAEGSHQRAGFIAQELVTVAPEAVHQPADPDEMMAVDYSKLVPMLVKEIQSLRKRLAALENK